VVKGSAPDVMLEHKEFSCPLPKGDIKGITMRTEIPEKLVAPVNKGDVVGQNVYLCGTREIGRSDIIAMESVEKMTFFKMMAEFFKKIAIYL
jgi:D-alanyl-D-alanine carboxypeptidase (penicillin-binding protein 5/6)